MQADKKLDSEDLIAAADRLLGEGELDGAIQAYSRALAVTPASANAWFNLAWAQRATRRFDDALASYANALALGVDRAEEVHLNRAVILSEFMFQPEQAIIELRAALAIDPQSTLALLNLANIHEDLGEVDEARAAYRAVLALDGGNGRAHARLAAIDIVTGAAATAVTDLNMALAAATTIDDRADILFALGSALDAAADYDGAFQAIEAGNWLARSVTPSGYDAAGQVELVNRIIRAYPIARPQPASVAVAPRPVFICGMFRSGSTLAEQMLGRHSAITAAGELDHIPAFARRLQPYPEAAAALPTDALQDLRAEYLRGLPPATDLTTDKRCDNFLHIGLIKSLFPDAKVVHTRRNPLDNLLSIYFLHFGHEVAYGHTLAEATHYYIQYRRMMDHWRALYAPDIFDLEYDALVGDPRATLEGVLDFLGLPFEEACLRPDRAAGAVRTASVWQTRQPLHRRSSGRWEHYRRHLDPMRRMLADAGY